MSQVDTSGSHTPMRIAIGLHSLQLGGSQINTIELAASLRDRGHSVSMFVIHEEFPTSVLPVAHQAGFDIEILPAEDSLSRQASRITEALDTARAEVVHVYHEDHWLGPLAAIATRSRPDVATVVTNWMMQNNRWLPLYAPLIVGTEALGDEAKSLQRGPVWVLEPPVDVEMNRTDPESAAEFRTTLGVAEDQVLAVCVTRVDTAMKLDSVLRAIAAVELMDDPSMPLVIVGDGDAMEIVRTKTAEANNRLGREAIRLTGALHDPRPAYGAADIVIAMGGSAIRGLAFGKPVVVVGEGNFSRVFDPGSAAYFLRHGFFGVEPGDLDPTSLAGQLRSLDDVARRAELAAFGSEVIRSRFALDVATDRLEQIYREAIEHPRSRAQRLADVGYVRGYDLAHRMLPHSIKARVRALVPRLRTE